MKDTHYSEMEKGSVVRRISIVTVALIGCLGMAVAPAFALGQDEGSISCANIAKVQSRTSGQTWVWPPGEADTYIGNFGSLTTRTTYETNPNNGHWEVLSGGGIDVNATFAACTNLPW